MFLADFKCNKCNHHFESVFDSRGECTVAIANSWVLCPKCNHSKVERVLTTGSVRTSKNRTTQRGPGGVQVTVERGDLNGPDVPLEVQKVVAAYRERVNRHHEDVGKRFAETMHRMHDGHEPHRLIRGKATQAEVKGMLDKGMDLVPMPPIQNIEKN